MFLIVSTLKVSNSNNHNQVCYNVAMNSTTSEMLNSKYYLSTSFNPFRNDIPDSKLTTYSNMETASKCLRRSSFTYLLSRFLRG
jgi:hypothetical protein